jgi:hypothetical protein
LRLRARLLFGESTGVNKQALLGFTDAGDLNVRGNDESTREKTVKRGDHNRLREPNRGRFGAESTTTCTCCFWIGGVEADGRLTVHRRDVLIRRALHEQASTRTLSSWSDLGEAHM